jgi:hypothetical protein
MLVRLVLILKVIFVMQGHLKKDGLDYIFALIGHRSERPLYDLNRFCLDHGVNAAAFSRFNILIFRSKKIDLSFSHKAGEDFMRRSDIDSS